ncbi:MAG: pyridoxal-phosphate dependent enzyme [Dysosmobacter sp.]|nr:pyridoxal-phosphate dependent enzyme [Dysosmobacter sp.]
MSKTLPLFDAYPQLQKGLPFVSLGVYPTPVEPLPGCSGICQVYIKRDDLSGEEYGGNKIRKLEFELGEARRQGIREVMTFGCDGSNHALATGIYAKKVGMQSTSILRTQHNARYVRKNLLKSMYYGIQMHHCETLEEMDALAALLQRQNAEKTGRPVYQIPVGGSSPLGTVGFVNAAFELRQQVNAGLLPEPDYIYAAAGTLGTVAGLTIGLDALGMKTKVVAVKVNSENRINAENYAELMNSTAALLRNADPSFPVLAYEPEDVRIEEKYYGGDYAIFTEEGVSAVNFMKEKYGIALEGTYTGKTCAAMLEAVREPVNQGKTVLFWNTLNSREPYPQALQADYHGLPKEFWRYFEEDVQPLDHKLL